MSITASMPRWWPCCSSMTGIPPPPAQTTRNPASTSCLIAGNYTMRCGSGDATTRRHWSPSGLTTHPCFALTACASVSVYWITAWAGNAAIAVGWVLYVEVFINKGQGKFWSIILVLVGLWVPAAVNLSGVRNMGVVQVVTSILKFAALAFMSVVGLF